jgi:hypothetical protein
MYSLLKKEVILMPTDEALLAILLAEKGEDLANRLTIDLSRGSPAVFLSVEGRVLINARLLAKIREEKEKGQNPGKVLLEALKRGSR